VALSKKEFDTCPIRDGGVERGGLMAHNLSHAEPAPDGQAGYVWTCKFGERDGVWDRTSPQRRPLG
jgi:hypothetical protein